MSISLFGIFQLICLNLLCNTAFASFKSDVWNQKAQGDIHESILEQPVNKVARNVIFFLGDGMGISTVTAARILKDEKAGKLAGEGYLSFERFPHMALLKTYNTDHVVADSASTATAYLSGVKANSMTTGVTEDVEYGNCTSYKPEYDAPSILAYSMKRGKSTGFVTNTRVTHASPAGLYAHSASRNWETDRARNSDVHHPKDWLKCKDIAAQLIDRGLDINVVMGGGRANFIPWNEVIPQTGRRGNRYDGPNLINEWKDGQQKKGRRASYISNRNQLLNIDARNTDYLFGLFNDDHLLYEDDRKNSEPSLAEMTETAIKLLSKNEKGFFLFVEGGKIDHANHANKAKKALSETLAFDLAIEKALSMTKSSETLILVSADHSHGLTINGYATRKRSILDIVDNKYGTSNIAQDGKPYSALLYASGPGASKTDVRRDISHDDVKGKNYRQQALIPFSGGTHSGEDVAVYASGPMAHLFHRVHEQNYVAHVMMYASCVGNYHSKNDCPPSNDSVTHSMGSFTFYIGSIVFNIVTLFCLI